MISEKANRRLDKALALGGLDHAAEVARVGPAADREQQLEVTVPLLVLEELEKVATQVRRTRIRVALVLDLLVGPCVGQLYGAGSRVNVGKCIENVRQVRERHMLGLEPFLINRPVGKVAYGHETRRVGGARRLFESQWQMEGHEQHVARARPCRVYVSLYQGLSAAQGGRSGAPGRAAFSCPSSGRGDTSDTCWNSCASCAASSEESPYCAYERSGGAGASREGIGPDEAARANSPVASHEHGSWVLWLGASVASGAHVALGSGASVGTLGSGARLSGSGT